MPSVLNTVRLIEKSRTTVLKCEAKFAKPVKLKKLFKRRTVSFYDTSQQSAE